MSLLGIDIGSSGCKGVVFNYSGGILAKAGREYSPYSPAPSMMEIDASVFKDSVFSIIHELSEKTLDNPIEALAISSHGETLIPVDVYDNPRGRAIMNSDNRAVEEYEFLENLFGKEVLYRMCGAPVHPMFPAVKILWLQRNLPELFNNSRYFLSAGDFIIQQMGLPPFTDYSLASRTLLFDVNKHKWSVDVLKAINLNSQQLGIPVQGGTIAGKLHGEAASILGLRDGVIVAVGGHDQPCNALGVGAINNGDVSLSAGTYECIAAIGNEPTLNEESIGYNINSYCHVVPGQYITLAFFPSGIMLSWFRNTFCDKDIEDSNKLGLNIYAYLDKKVPGNPTGICITPHIVGACNPYWDVHATTIIAGVTPSVTRYHIYKALMEGTCCELDINIKVLESFGFNLNSLKVSGGGAKSRLWMQLRADITGKTMQSMENSESACLGAAILAGVALGVYKDVQDAVDKVVRINKSFEPNEPDSSSYYIQKLKYALLYEGLKAYRNNEP